MNTTTKILIGATIGAGVGYFVGAVIAEIIRIKEDPFYNEDYHDSDEFPQDDGIEVDENEGMKLMERPRSGGVMSKTVKKNYSEIFKKNPDLEALVRKYNTSDGPVDDPTLVEDVVEDMQKIEDEFAEPEDTDNQPISIISLAEYANNQEGFETLTLNYYDDDVVTDEHDEPISHPEQLLGDDALVSFGELSEDEDVVYVRNRPKKALYEVVRTNKNYGVQLQKSRRLAAKAAMKKRDRIDRMGEEENYGEDNT
jgi:hypothetical protein